MGPAAFLLVVAPAAAFVMAPRATCGCRYTRCSAGLHVDGSIADSRREFLAQQRPTRGAEAFANTQWSLLLKMNGGGGTMFSVELRDDMRCRFSDNDETGGDASFRGYRQPALQAATLTVARHDRSQVAGRRRRSGSSSRSRKASKRA
jgi:hypothetical protein